MLIVLALGERLMVEDYTQYLCQSCGKILTACCLDGSDDTDLLGFVRYPYVVTRRLGRRMQGLRGLKRCVNCAGEISPVSMEMPACFPILPSARAS